MYKQLYGVHKKLQKSCGRILEKVNKNKVLNLFLPVRDFSCKDGFLFVIMQSCKHTV